MWPLLAVALIFPMSMVGQASAPANTTATGTTKAASTVDRAVTGDAPDNAGPLASDLSPKLEQKAIRKAMSKVADWQVAYAEKNFNRQWTYAALYDGLLAASRTTGNPAYRAAVERLAEQNHWTLVNDRFPHADDMALGQAYMDLYLEQPKKSREAVRMSDTRAVLDQLVARKDDPAKLVWWWCDALFMAPPVLTRMYEATGDQKYLDTMDREWWLTSGQLYDPTERLYFRDARYLTQTEKNGQKLFWSRGNGWVMGGLVNVLSALPADYPSRARYVAQFQQMADRIAELQGKDGLWRSGLLDAADYPLPEVSGSAFFVYAMAWGINQHLLDAKRFQPVVEKGWAGLLQNVYADGRLGSIQPIDAQPGQFKPSASYVYGVGSFLLAGSELDKLAGR